MFSSLGILSASPKEPTMDDHDKVVAVFTTCLTAIAILLLAILVAIKFPWF
jgi:hypothetical protein